MSVIQEHRAALSVFAAIGVLLSGFALTVDYPRAAGTFWSDAATYYTMAHSLAEDGDLQFTRADVERVFQEFPNGPSGIFLKRGQELELTLVPEIPFLVSKGPLTDDLYFAKAFLYSLAAAPLVRLFGTNGMLLLHAILFTLVLVAGYFFLAAFLSRMAALGVTLTFFLASVGPAYFVWLTPELFNMCLVFFGAFFWLYKERAENPPYWLSGPRSDLVAAALWGAVTYSKPSNLLLIAPLLVLLMLRREWKRLLVTGVVFSIFLGGLFLIQLGVTGDMNYQGGERKTFGGRYPYQRSDLNFENTGLSMATNVVYTYQPWDIILRDLYLYHVGRFSGTAVYFFPAVAAAIAFLASRSRRTFQWLVLAMATAGCLLWIVWTPTNYFGGGGTLGNRYFMNLFPLYLFLIPVLKRPWLFCVIAWAVASVFVSAILAGPFTAGRQPGAHATNDIFRWLPPELSSINHLPTNSDPKKFRQRFDDGFLGYFLDNNTWFRERRSPGGLGFHVKGGTETQMVVRTRFELKQLIVRVTNVATEPNRIRVCVPGGCETRTVAPGEKQILELAAGRAFPYEDFGVRSFCYLVSVDAEKGSVPELVRRDSTDDRYLGAFIHIEPDPYPGID